MEVTGDPFSLCLLNGDFGRPRFQRMGLERLRFA
jgi:hypothetical protein